MLFAVWTLDGAVVILISRCPAPSTPEANRLHLKASIPKTDVPINVWFDFLFSCKVL